MSKQNAKAADISTDAVRLNAAPAVLPPEPAVKEVVEPKKRHDIPHADIGNWKFTPWKDKPMWTHTRTGESSFKADYVSRRRNQ